MKYIKQRRDLIFIVNPLLIVGGFFLFWHALEYIIPALQLFWATTLAAAIIIFSPWGNIRLCQNHDEVAKRISFSRWILRILLLEFSMIGTFAGICLVSGNLFPIMTQQHPFLFSLSISHMMTLGLFPWPLYALVTVSMCALAYRQQTHAFFSNLLSPILRQGPQDTLGLTTNIGSRRCTLFAISTTLMFISLLLLGLVLSPDIHLMSGFKPAALLTTLFLLFFSSTKIVLRYTDRLFSKKIPTALGFLIFCLLLAASLLLLNIITTGITLKSNDQNILPAVLIPLIQKNWSACWIVFAVIWWLCFTPSVCGYIANISKGYRARDVILAVLAAPILIAAALALAPHWLHYWPIIPAHIEKLIAIISSIVFLSLTLNHKNAPNVIMSYFPKNGVTKHRDRHFFFQRVVKLSVVTLYIFFVLGINALSMTLFFLTYLFILTYVLAGLLAITNLRKVSEQGSPP